jgi:hypothetical protein
MLVCDSLEGERIVAGCEATTSVRVEAARRAI